MQHTFRQLCMKKVKGWHNWWWIHQTNFLLSWFSYISINVDWNYWEAECTIYPTCSTINFGLIYRFTNGWPHLSRTDSAVVRPKITMVQVFPAVWAGRRNPPFGYSVPRPLLPRCFFPSKPPSAPSRDWTDVRVLYICRLTIVEQPGWSCCKSWVSGVKP